MEHCVEPIWDNEESMGLEDAAGRDGEIERGLSALGVVAPPPSLLAVVLADVGIADVYATVTTQIGPVYVAHNRGGISAVGRAVDAAAFEADFAARHGRVARPIGHLPTSLARAIATVLDGATPTRLRFDLRGKSSFERAVLDKARDIPRGEVRPYAWVAAEIGRPKAVRAVGTALGRNPAPLLIPCHRVVASDGRPGHYVWGTDAKRALLASEGVDPTNLDEAARAGIRFTGSDTTKIFCFPTCRHARRTTPRHTVAFGSAAAAAAAGYRPCRVCRPVEAA